MKSITVDLEEVLNMIMANEGIPPYRMVLISARGDVSYIFLVQDTPPQHWYIEIHFQLVVNPEIFFNMSEINRYYPLDIYKFRTIAKDNIQDELKKDSTDFTELDWNKVSKYEWELIDDWKQVARHEKKEIIEIEDSHGEVIAEFKIEWV